MRSTLLALSLVMATPLPALGHGGDSPVASQPVLKPAQAEPDEGTMPLLQRDLVVIDVQHQHLLKQANMPVIWKGASFILAEWSDEQAAAHANGIPFEVVMKGVTDDRPIWIFEMDNGLEPPADWGGRILYRKGRKVLIEMDEDAAQYWATQGYHPILVPHKANGWEAPVSFVPFSCTYSAVTSTLLGRTSQSQWLDWIRKVSGVDTVNIAGTDYTIRTRHSSTTFTSPTPSQAHGYDYLLQQVQSWHYPAGNVEEDSYTNPPTGATWKNVIVTIPGQTSPGEVVVLSAHYDSTSTDAANNAPGANDNGTGTATILEAARLLRQFRFQRTVKLIWFTGEEQGLYGSAAYTNDHSMTPIQGVVNLDMFGWDGDGDRCFEIHAGSLSQSQDVGSCFAASVGAYSLGLSYDFETTTATDRSDHASFWNKNIGAIEIAENYFNDGLAGGCTQWVNNTLYHTVNDKLPASVTLPYSYDIARAGLATISAMAVPIEACFATAPALTATSDDSSIRLSWTTVAGASSYRVYRSVQGCQGQWSEIGSSAGTTMTDAGATLNQTYYYHVEAVAPDGFCVSAPSACATAVPRILHASATSSAVLDSCPGGGPGSADGVIDPGETVVMQVTALNDGNVALTNLAGALSSASSGVFVTDGSATWPNLAVGAASASNPDHFTFQVARDFPCGQNIATNLALSYTEGANTAVVTKPTGSQSQTFLVNETFSSGNPPAGWTVVHSGTGTNAAATWTTANPANRAISSPFTAPFAIVDSDFAGQVATQDEQLVTPPFDATGCGNVQLEFSNQFRWYSGSLNETADVDVTTNGGSSWTNIVRMQGAADGYPNPITKNVNLTSAVSASPANVKLRFHYYNAKYEFWWAIDNVRVRCDRAGCNICQTGGGPPGEAGAAGSLLLHKGGGSIDFTWGGTGACDTRGYAVYRGSLGTLRTTGYSHGTALTCTSASTSFSIAANDPRLGTADYYLVVADNGAQEGSYGRLSSGVERPASGAACRPPQNLASCAP